MTRSIVWFRRDLRLADNAALAAAIRQGEVIPAFVIDPVLLNSNRVGPKRVAMLAALLKPTSGGIFIDGHDLTKMGEGERAQFRREKIGFTIQANNLVPYLTAQENVELIWIR